jgi:hypothetical protein
MATIDPEVDFLRQKQRSLLVAQGRSAPMGLADMYSILNDSAALLTPEQIEQGKAAIERASTFKPPSEYQDLGTYGLMADLAEQVRRTANSMGIRIPSEPLLASFASGRVNALTIHVQGARHPLVVFEDEMFTFANLFTKALAQTLVFAGEDEGALQFSLDREAIAEQIRSRPEIAQRFWEALTAYVVDGRPSAAPQYYLWGPPSMMAERLREGLELFVIAHEFGHVIRNHSSAMLETMRLLDEEDIETIRWNWQQEHSADGIGMTLAVGAFRERYSDLALGFAGTDLFFSLQKLLDRALSVLTTGDEDSVTLSPTHPSAAARRKVVLELLNVLVQPADALAAIALSDGLRDALELLWDSCRDRLAALRAQGVTPDRRWLAALREA